MSGSSGISWECHWGEAILLLHSLPRVFVFGLAGGSSLPCKAGAKPAFCNTSKSITKTNLLEPEHVCYLANPKGKRSKEAAR